MFADSIKALCLGAVVSSLTAECLSGSEAPSFEDFTMPPHSTVRTSEPVNWAFEQSKDPNISKVISILQKGGEYTQNGKIVTLGYVTFDY
jgi:hypothetical protein